MDDETAAIEAIWAGDVLQRRQEADYLTTFLDARYARKPTERGFVLALNAEWGIGKSFMVTRWAEALRAQGRPAFYFDAWANDFTSEPLLAFIAEVQKSDGLREIVSKVPAALQAFDSAIGKARRLWRPLSKIAMATALKHVAGLSIEKLDEILFDEENPSSKGSPASEVAKNALDKLTESSLKEHASKKQAIKEFKASLETLINQLCETTDVKLPIFFFVDELDRCRPNYAIELLEGIKHLFGVPGVYFIVSTNLHQLGESTKAVYGPGFSGTEYLKRFFDLEYSLPRPNNLAFAKALLGDIFDTIQGRAVHGLSNQSSQGSLLPHIFAVHAASFNIGLRDQEQVARIVEAALVALEGKIHIHFLLFLAILYQQNTSVFHAVLRHRDFGSETEFNKLLDKVEREAGQFTVTDVSYDTGTVKSKRVAAHAIAGAYLGVLGKEVRDLRSERYYEQPFPGSLLVELANEWSNTAMFGNKRYPISINTYPEIVMHAGRFLTPLEPQDRT